MKRCSATPSVIVLLLTAPGSGVLAQADSLEAAFTGGKAGGQFNLRYEGVSEDGMAEDAQSLTLRSALRFSTASLSGFSGVIELEDVRYLGLHDYSVPATGFNTGRYPVISDPETTELNQAYLQYQQGGFLARLGRQDIRHDDQRMIGAVPWRQDYQSFDALTLEYQPDAGGWSLAYHYIDQRERIFAEAADIDSRDHLLYATMATPLGSLVAYGLLLEEDIALDNAQDTWGLRLSGSKRLYDSHDLSWLVEYAIQDYERGPAAHDTDYLHLEAGVVLHGFTTKLGVEVLGSDDGAWGFSTPLATLHAFYMFIMQGGGTMKSSSSRGIALFLGGLLSAAVLSARAEVGPPEKDDLRFGFIKLTDMAPLAATIGYGTQAHIVTPFSMDLNGNGITVSNSVWQAMKPHIPMQDGKPVHPIKADALKPVVQEYRDAGKPFNTGMVFPVSTHNYELRYWLAAGGIHPGYYAPHKGDTSGTIDAEVLLSVTPPPQMPATLEAGTIYGYSVGEPWNQQAVFKALLRAAKWLDEHREEAVAMLARPQYVGADREVIANSMTGTFEYERGDKREVPDFNVFFRYHATCPYYSDAVWYLTQMRRWGQIAEPKPDAWYFETAASVYRPDIYRLAAEALIEEGVMRAEDFPDFDRESGYRAPTSDFIDGVEYDGRRPNDYLRAATIGLKDEVL